MSVSDRVPIHLEPWNQRVRWWDAEHDVESHLARTDNRRCGIDDLPDWWMRILQ